MFWGEFCKEKHDYLIEKSTEAMRNHLNKGNVQLNKKGTKLLSVIFVKKLSQVFYWHNIDLVILIDHLTPKMQIVLKGF